MDISDKIREQAPAILAEVERARSILLHCHPTPDPDSVGSALGMKFALESLGKKVTLIAGDSPIPEAFGLFPGVHDILAKNYFELTLADFDLFIILDSSNAGMVSKKGEVSFPPGMTTVVIDHHASNVGFGTVNLIDPSSPATAQIVFDLLQVWKVEVTPSIAANIFMGIYADTGGFKYAGTTPHTFEVASILSRIYPEYAKVIDYMENDQDPSYAAFIGLGLTSVKEYFGGLLALAEVPYARLIDTHIDPEKVSPSSVSRFMRTVRAWTITGTAVEIAMNETRFSFRSKDVEKYNLSGLMASLGGGGHPAAAGLTLKLPLSQAVQKVVETMKDMYNL